MGLLYAICIDAALAFQSMVQRGPLVSAFRDQPIIDAFQIQFMEKKNCICNTLASSYALVENGVMHASSPIFFGGVLGQK